MGLFKRAHIRGMAHELTVRGIVTWPSKLAEEEAADAIADDTEEEEIPEVTDDSGLSPEQAAAVVNKLVEVANEISDKTGGYVDTGVNKTAAATSYEDAAAAAAMGVMYKAAEETAAGTGPDVPGAGTPSPASGATAETAIDSRKTPSSAWTGPQGTSDLSTAGGAVGKEEKRDQPGAQASAPSGEVAKLSYVMNALRKMSADGASLSGGEVKGKAPEPRKDLPDNLVIPGAVASGKGQTAQDIPASAMVGDIKPNPAGTPGRSAATPNEVAKDASYAALKAAELLLSTSEGRKYLNKLSEDACEHEKKETKKEEEKEEAKKEAIASALANLARAIGG